MNGFFCHCLPAKLSFWLTCLLFFFLQTHTIQAMKIEPHTGPFLKDTNVQLCTLVLGKGCFRSHCREETFPPLHTQKGVSLTIGVGELDLFLCLAPCSLSCSSI